MKAINQRKKDIATEYTNRYSMTFMHFFIFVFLYFLYLFFSRDALITEAKEQLQLFREANIQVILFLCLQNI